MFKLFCFLVIISSSNSLNWETTENEDFAKTRWIHHLHLNICFTSWNTSEKIRFWKKEFEFWETIFFSRWYPQSTHKKCQTILPRRLASYNWHINIYSNIYTWSKSFIIKYTCWVFVTNSHLLIPISLQPDGVNHWYFKLSLFDLREFVVWNM